MEVNFKSAIEQEGSNINAKQLFADIQKQLETEKAEHPNMRIARRHPLQHILNSTSGGYVSPTSMKSFELCPAGYLFGKLVPELKGAATSVGNTVHSILCKFYSQDGKDRTYESILRLTEETIKEDEQFAKADDVRAYIKGYMSAGDYLGGQMQHHLLSCETEVFLKPQCQPLGIDLGVPIYTLVDRIDVRETGIYVIDYKTGFGDPNPYLLGENGYLPQMIFYKWVTEATYGMPISGSFLCLPGAATPSNYYVPMNVNSLVEQSKVVEKVLKHVEHAREVRDSLMFPQSIMRYCGSCQLKNRCAEYRKNHGAPDASGMFDTINISISYDSDDYFSAEEQESN